MTRLKGRTLTVPGFVAGVIQDMDAENAPLGSVQSASNLVPTPAGRLAVRGGSRLVNTLHDDAGTPAELTHLLRIQSFTPVGMVVVGWSNGVNKHFAYRLTDAGAFLTGTEATSRIDLTAAPSTSWNNASTPARPLMAELWEKLFLVDATVTYASRNKLLSIDSAGTVLEPAFDFGGGASDLLPYCLAEYNNVLFIAGYDDAASEPAIVRHSFLGRSPDATTVGAEGFDPRAWAIFGAKGQRVTGMQAGNNILLVAKANELYRVSGYGRAYPGWQYQIDKVDQTLGLGVSNPFALTFAEGYWYGIGAQGPFRTDGFRVEPLRGPRETAWSQTTNPETQFVEYHPDRGLICFGVRQPVGLPPGLYLAAGGVTPATYPNVLWTWDIARSVYGPDQGFGLSLFHIRAIPSTTVQSPSGNPTATAASFISASAFTANWTNGDATAQTEYYEKAGVAGSYGLVSTEAAADTDKARASRTSYTRYFYKLIHIKSGIRSSESNEIEVKTHLPAPVVTSTTGSSSGGGTIPSELHVTVAVSGATLYVEQSADGVSGWSTVATVPAATASEYTYLNGGGVVTTGFYYRAYSEDLAWTPTTGATSNVEFLNPEVGP